ncbi:hypothetical protein SVAN01_11636 [Stagonosporopsis vannaccii]|nr:hypothetical protein SVAN01_11636 [Stagonosporopsis vannaccii]
MAHPGLCPIVGVDNMLPYYVPWLGHTISFMRCAEKMYAQGSRHFKNKEIYALTIAGGTTVVVSDTADLAAVWKNTTALSYDPFVSRMLTAFGISKANVEKSFQAKPSSFIPETHSDTLLVTENPRQKCYMHLQSDWFKKQLLPGENLTQLQDDYAHHLDRVMHLENLQGHFVASHTSNNQVTVSLGRFTRHILSHCAFRAFFGEALFELEPEFAKIYQTWEDDSWKVFYNYPYILAKDLHNARIRAIDTLARYYQLPSEARKPCWLFGVMNTELEAIGFSSTDRAGMVMMICWAINNNAHYICFWMVSHMLCNPNLFSAVRSEIDACFDSNGAVSLDKLLSQCANLDGTWNEALRLYNASTAVRKANADCFIGNKIIHKDDQIFGPVRNWQLDGHFFGEDAGIFRAERWLKRKDLARSKGFTPFGGGHTYCPGRYFAQRETYFFVAQLLRRFELQVSDADGNVVHNPQVPRVEINLPSPAAMRPVHDMHITMKARKVAL